MTSYNDTEEIRKHYDVVSPYYRALWGEHIHHGYWIDGDESKEKAQIQLIEHLAQAAGIQPGCKILDVGCGVGGSSIHLARKYHAEVTGITISPVQVEMARKAAASAGVNARFLLMNAEAMNFDEAFDVVWSVESISHYRSPGQFFAIARRLLKPAGKFAMTDWFKKENFEQQVHQQWIHPIEKSMLVELHTMEDYQGWMRGHGLEIIKTEILNKHCAKTWDICMDIINDKAFWKLAVQNGAEFVNFLRGFRAMRAGFVSGNFIYGLIVAKPAFFPQRGARND
ncbi:MAG: methyltransferase domain-containing protein [Candidatus Acidiferrum sp.]